MTVADVRAQLRSIAELTRTVRISEAERVAEELIDGLDRVIAIAIGDEIAAALPLAFHKKRARDLRQRLDLRLRRLGVSQRRVLSDPVGSPIDGGSVAAPVPTSGLTHLDHQLTDLADNHIFQWMTFYRDAVLSIFASATAELDAAGDDWVDLASMIESAFSKHSTIIFEKGYRFKRQQAATHETIRATTLSGLRRFLDLPIEAFIAATSTSQTRAEVIVLRRVCAAIIYGIVFGFAKGSYGSESGTAWMAFGTRSWTHSLPFMTQDVFTRLLPQVASGDEVEGIGRVMQPLLGVVDSLLTEEADCDPLIPTVAHYAWDRRCLEITFNTLAFSELHDDIDVHCYVSRAATSKAALEESARRGTSLIVAVSPPDAVRWAREAPDVHPSFVDADSHNASDRIKKLLVREHKASTATDVIKTNYAKKFPITDPVISPWFKVFRRTVRNLFRDCSGTNGIHLWSSIRRSGKTTACMLLGGESQATC